MSNGNTQTLTSNTSSDGVDVLGPAIVRVNEGTWDSATAQIEYYDSTLSEWKDVVDGAFTADFNKVLNFPEGAENTLRVTTTGGGGSLDIDVNIQGSSPRKY